MEIFTIRNKAKEQTFKQLFEKYYAPFCIYAKRYINDSTLREDLVSDAFTSLWSKRDDIDFNEDTIIAYIKTSVKNNCLNYIKHQSYELNYAEQCLNNQEIFANSPDCVYTLKELYERLNKSLEKLPQSYQEVFIKLFYEGKTHSKIASEMNISIKTVDRYKTKVIQELSKEFKEYLPLLILIIQYNDFMNLVSN